MQLCSVQFAVEEKVVVSLEKDGTVKSFVRASLRLASLAAFLHSRLFIIDVRLDRRSRASSRLRSTTPMIQSAIALTVSLHLY